jgi:hypothetical protein
MYCGSGLQGNLLRILFERGDEPQQSLLGFASRSRLVFSSCVLQGLVLKR